ncbi:tumor necrosis factor receptor superfamily member 5-like [Xyrichtys novacula]|uniref:Tumor necrosis factor receptor superfamily member 5-like n=1 Tax=Xyrichtys novacula TaxID=13765 RepID=A0AAV1HFX2_XYRNO|nr:tumor necrosis factor receptor superfamily member 5-like [Xyrichtys novacula]
MKMHLLLVFAFIVVVSAQPQCDPETQYEKNGACCKMCPPGTRMLSSGTCDEPRCEDCGEREYQDKYTTEPKCQRQPYCDPNKNFNQAIHVSKKKATICECKHGFHCSSEQCIICVPHTICPQGKGAKIKGNHSRDTECEVCTDGTFSDVSSWDSECKKWTECGNDYHIKETGTASSDNICGELLCVGRKFVKFFTCRSPVLCGRVFS